MRLWWIAVFASVVATGSADIFRPSKADQVKLGLQASEQIRKKEKVLPDSDIRVKTLRRLGEAVLRTFVDKDVPWKYTFDVVESKEVNAFALPGGPTFFYTGLLDRMATEDELIGVLGHELTHVRKEHWARGYGEQQKRQLGLALLLGLTKANDQAAQAAVLADGLLFTLPFSRRYEYEADEGGYTMMTKAGYNPKGLTTTFEMLAKASGGGKPPEWLSTHPADTGRIKRIQQRIDRESLRLPDLRPLPFDTAAKREQKTGVIGLVFRDLITAR
ncbi:MAG: M48 family metallopeptidase [Fimbriimonas sp.]